MFKRPIAAIGAGAAQAQISRLIEWGIPVVKTWGAYDKIPCDHELCVGGFGVVGSRVGNWAAQNCDLLIIVGTELNQQITGQPKLFATQAEKVDFTYLEMMESNVYQEWIEKLKESKKTHAALKDYWIDSGSDDVCPYLFMRELNKHTREGDIIITDAGMNLCVTMQGIRVKNGMRVISAWNFSPMGYSLPAAIGASLARPGSRVICIIGDGGLMMSFAELATLARHSLPIKIFLFNNQGQSIQKQTAETWLSGRKHGMDYESGLGFPDFEKISDSFGIPHWNFDRNTLLHEIEYVLKSEGPQFCNIWIDPSARISPFMKSGQRLEDL